MGNSGSTDTATLAFTFSGTSTIRTWEIKATQIPCGSPVRAPEGCLQFHTTLAGRFQTFNFAETTTPMHLASQKYDTCNDFWKFWAIITFNLKVPIHLIIIKKYALS